MKSLKTLKVNLIDPTRHNPRRIRAKAIQEKGGAE